ncbi:MAG TPA: hypothetical protein PLO78_02640 [Candidatus Omnitrophota bacterium]|nr:hypothetical protein [Candidatus Omnitrophota bacterium]
MNYFKFLSILLGAWMVLGGLWVVFFQKKWENIFLKIYPDKRPQWLPAIGFLILLWVLGTWMELWKAASIYGFVVTLVLSLGLVKIVPLIFFYKKSREILIALVNEPLALRVVMLSSAAIGGALLTMGLFF